MKPLSKQLLAVGFLLTAAILIGGCIFSDGENLKAKWEKAQDHTVPLASGSLIQVENHNGPIVTRGADTRQCRVEAKIQVRAETEAIAQKIAQQTQILLQEADHKLIIKLDKPATTQKHSISVDYTITAPHQVSLHAVSHNGKLQISDLQGDINGKTHNGKVVCLQIQGEVSLETHNGDIDCQEITGPVKVITHNGTVKVMAVNAEPAAIEATSHNGEIECRDIWGDLNAETHNGQVIVVYNHAANSSPNVRAITYNDNIHFTGPPGLSAQVDLSTHNGSVHSDLPVKVQGELSKHKLQGTIGNGDGTVQLQTHNGSIRIH